MRSVLLELSFSLSFLRTTPARKPRTECCCQPVAFIIAAMVVPSGDDSSATTRDCLEPVSVFLISGSLVVLTVFIVAGTRVVAAVADFFAAFDIEILHSVQT